MLTTLQMGAAARVPQHHLIDLVLAPADSDCDGNPHDVDLAATFVGPSGRALRIPGFYDSLKGFVVRFSAPVQGVWRYRAEGAVVRDRPSSGEIVCYTAAAAAHGALVVDRAHPQHFCFEEGEHCFLFGYEANWLPCVDQSPSDMGRINTFLDTVQSMGANMLTMNVYAHTCRSWLTPEQETDERYIKPLLAPWVGGNDEPDYGRFDSAFFEHLDRVMLALLQRGMLAHLMVHVYNKQVNWPEFGSAADDRYWRYVVARYQAFCNVIWDPAKESYYRSPEYIWDRMGFIRSHDAYRRLITVHDSNTPHVPASEWSQRHYDPRKEMADELADFKSDQVHSNWYDDARHNYVSHQRPYMNIEYGYEQGVDDLPTYSRKQGWQEVLRRTWRVVMGGGYPNYYYSNTAWNLFVPLPKPPGYEPHRALADLLRDTTYWRLTPDQSPLDTRAEDAVFCRCDPGREYLVYDESGSGFDLATVAGECPFSAIWLNAITGERLSVGGVVHAGRQYWLSPWGAGTMAVLLLVAK